MVFDPELLAKIEQRKRSNPAPAGRRFYTETQRKLACGLDVSDRSADSTDCSINNTTQETLYTPIRSADRRELILRRQELTRRTFTAMGGDYNQFETAPPKFEPNITIENTDESDDEETSMASTLQDEDTPPTKKSRQYREPSSPLEHKAESDQEMEETREHDEIVVSSYEEDQSMPVVRSGIRPSRASSEPMFDDDDARSTSYSLSRNEEEQSLDAPTPETGPRPQNQHQDEDTPPTKKSRQYREPSSPLEHNAGSDQEMEELPKHDEFVVSSYEEESYIAVVHSGIRPSRASSELIFGDDNARSTSYSLSRNEKDLSLDDPAPETCPRPRNQHRFGRRNFDNSTIADSMTPFVVPQRNQRKSNKKTDATSTSLIEEDDGEHIEMVLKKPSLVVPDSPDGPLRRSQRTRVAPMRRWLGEEPVYESSPGGSRTMTDVSRVVMRDPLFVKTKSSDIVKANNRARRDK